MIKKNANFLIKDHKSNVGQERKRIHKTGETITKHKVDVRHIENQLAVSRALDDYSIDKHTLLALSDLVQYSKQSSLACLV